MNVKYVLFIRYNDLTCFFPIYTVWPSLAFAMTDKLLPEFFLTIIERLLTFNYTVAEDLLFAKHVQCIIIIIRTYLQGCTDIVHISFLDSSARPVDSG